MKATNIPLTKGQALFQLLLSLNKGDTAYATERVHRAIEQLEQLESEGVKFLHEVA